MTTVPTTPPAVMGPPRQAMTVGPPVSGASIDPVKLLNRHKWLLVAGAASGALFGAGANFALESMYPRWRPIAVFNCNPPMETIGQTAMVNPEEMNRFIQTQIKIMTSDTVLQKVVEDPQLPKLAPAWCKYYSRKDPGTGAEVYNSARALRALRDDVSVRNYPNTTLLELSYSDRNREDATAIVGLVREKYLAKIAADGDSQKDDRTRSLRDALARVEREVADLQTRRKSLIDKNSLESIEQSQGAAQQQVQRLQEEIIKTRQDLTATLSQKNGMAADISNPEGFNFNDEIKAEAERDPTVLDMRTTLSRMESELQAMLTTRTRDHREYQAMKARIDGARQNLDDTLVKVQRKLFDARLDTLRKNVDSLQAQENDLNRKLDEARTRLVTITSIASEIKDIDLQVDNLLKTRADNNGRLQEIITVSNLQTSNRVVEYQREKVPQELSFPQLKFMIPLGIIMGLGLVGGVVVLREIADQRIKGPSDINLIPKGRLLGWVPDAAEDPEGKGAAETAFRDRPKGVVAESYRQLRSAVLKRIEHAGHKTIMIASGMPGAGATSVIANLALALAAADKRVLVVDANLRRPSLHRVFGLQESPGIADVLMGQKVIQDVIQKTSAPNVDLISAGSKELRVVERLAAQAKGDLNDYAKAHYDVVLYDAAPAVVAGDAVAISQRVDATILVVRAMSDKRGMVARISNEFASAKSDFLGVVVNGVRASSGGYMKGNIRTASEYAKA
ncbi:MAG: polysaccharide biosynthesis tyrosine autokinase [Planctomycetes bacterium]|nr:polysaccharide biosynthesis tyrosine autokinase [Planctomycetota bacterium]